MNQLELPIERIAALIHDRYVETFGDVETSPSWADLSDDEREQSRSQAREIEQKLALVSRQVVETTDDREFDEQEIELLAPIEHQRWVRVESARGHGPGALRNAGPEKRHPDLVPWDELDEHAKNKDRSAVRSIPLILRLNDFGTERIPLKLRLGVVGHEALSDQPALVGRLEAIMDRVRGSISRNKGAKGRGVSFELVVTGWGRAHQLRDAVERRDSRFCGYRFVEPRRVEAPPTPMADRPRIRVEGDVVEFSETPTGSSIRVSHSVVESGVDQASHEMATEYLPTGHDELEVAVGAYRDPTTAWERRSEEVADRSDILVTISPRHLGFGQRSNEVPLSIRKISRYARTRRFHVYVLDPTTFRCLRWPLFRSDFVHYLTDTPNRSQPEVHDPEAGFAYEDEELRPYANQVDAFFEPHIDRADALAIAHKHVYYRIGALVLVAAAVALAAFGARVTVAPRSDWLRIVEPCALAVALFLQGVSTFGGSSRRWLTYRGLAERLRSAKFLALASHRAPTNPAARSVTGTEPWVAAEAWQLWDSWTAQIVSRSGVKPRAVVGHLRDHWVLAQLGHHRARVAVCERNERRLRSALLVAAATTLALLTLIAAGTFEDFHEPGLEFATFLIPILAGLSTGIGEQREWRHYVARSRRTARELEQLAADLDDLALEHDDARLAEQLHAIALRIDKALRHDLKDWFWSMELSEIHAD